MSQQITKQRSWKDLYRLVIMKEETLEEVSTYKLTILNIYIFISSVLIILSTLIVLALFFTPLKKLVPGYGDPHENAAYSELYLKVQDMDKQLEAYRLYTQNFRQIVMGFDSTSADKQDLVIAPKSSEEAFENEWDQDELQREQPAPVIDVDPDMPSNIGENSPTERKINSIAHLFFVSPVKGPISSGYDPEIEHFGVDILAPRNTPVKAIMDGYVITSDWTLETGNTLGIQHSYDLVSFYKHNAVLLKKPGTFVKAGEAIALIGNTGKFTTGPHLHFELWQSGQPIDPVNYINFQ